MNKEHSSRAIHIECRVIYEAELILETEGTIRSIAEQMNMSKSTVHKDLTKHLPQICAPTAAEVRILLDKNKAERHIRGGIATGMKYKKE